MHSESSDGFMRVHVGCAVDMMHSLQGCPMGSFVHAVLLFFQASRLSPGFFRAPFGNRSREIVGPWLSLKTRLYTTSFYNYFVNIEPTRLQVVRRCAYVLIVSFRVGE